jgi:hypothetical protein
MKWLAEALNLAGAAVP